MLKYAIRFANKKRKPVAGHEAYSITSTWSTRLDAFGDALIDPGSMKPRVVPLAK